MDGIAVSAEVVARNMGKHGGHCFETGQFRRGQCLPEASATIVSGLPTTEDHGIVCLAINRLLAEESIWRRNVRHACKLG